MYAALALDPIVAFPWHIARLTDFQVERLYMRPAAKRAREAGGGPGPGAAAPAAGDVTDMSEGLRRQIEAGELPNKAAMMSLLMTFGGLSAKDAAAEYEKQVAEHRKQRN